uniref:IST1-like protein n=1 Tax=Erigeron canadensis TaxID=72917 RepID=UPI001CB9CC4E|nr:IST1-like protein [Erigeron canadensis]XP_043635703.1 IST1-like protein [Erigeron canadensis]
MDSFFSKGSFKASKCKTLLKLTIPRIKLLRNRREIHIKQMRRDIAKLLETGQEATARIRVEHIIREEKMMAAQEIIELFCELVVVRLPIIESQRECPLDLKEAISSLCFAAPRCADLPELIQVQMAFAGKYGKEFVAAATELMPECGVNRQLIEHLSVRAPAPEVKLNLLKEIAEEHELDWDPTASETELLKPHEDLLNGPTQLASPKLPLPEEKFEEPVHTTSEGIHNEQSDSDEEYDMLDLPEVPNSLVQPTAPSESVSRPEMLPFPPSALSDLNDEADNILEKSTPKENEEKQFLPFISPPSETFMVKESSPSPQTKTTVDHDLQTSTVKENNQLLRTRTGIKDDLQDVLVAAQAAAESAERAAAAARAAASLAQVRISELVRKQNMYETNENPFSTVNHEPITPEKSNLDHQDSVHNSSSPTQSMTSHQPQRLPSMDDGFMSYPNLFTSRGPGELSRDSSFADNSRSNDGH